MTTQPLTRNSVKAIHARATSTGTPASSPAQRRRKKERLLRLWALLAQKAACAAAHGDTEESTLVTALLQVEETLLERWPSCRTLMDELIVWESSLVHVADERPARSCLICRRAFLSLPAGVPLPVASPRAAPQRDRGLTPRLERAKMGSGLPRPATTSTSLAASAEGGPWA